SEEAKPAGRNPRAFFARVRPASGKLAMSLDVVGAPVMAITVDAVYENGTLKLDKPLPLDDRAKVRVTIHSAPDLDQVQKAYGLLGWTGDSETVQRVALDPEFGIRESS